MDKELLGVFNLMATLKGFQREPYIIDKEDAFIIYNYWKIYDLYKYLSLKGFRKCVVEYSVFKGLTLHSACEELCKKIKF